MIDAARRQRDLLQDRLSARLCRRPAAGAASSPTRGKKVFARSQAARHRQHRHAWCGERGRSWAPPSLTVHAYPQTMKAAVEGRGGSSLKILAVTVLTSYNDDDLHAAGYRLSVSELVEARAQQAQALGVDGLVCSPRGGGARARDRRPPDDAGDTRHPPGGCCDAATRNAS